MNKQPHPDRSLLHFMLRAQQIAQQEGRSDKGYAMVIVSIITIVMFSLLTASLVFSNLAKSRTDAFVDTQSSFAVAEAGLNKRAIEFKKKLESYSGVDGVIDSTGDRALTACFGITNSTGGTYTSSATGTNDFECRNYGLASSNNMAKVVAAGGDIAMNSGGKDKNNYVAYTVVSDRTNYTNGAAQFITIPSTDDYAGLNAAEYKYTIYSTAKKPVTSPTSSTLPTYTDAQKAAINRQQQGKTAESGDAALIAAYNTDKASKIAAGATADANANSSSNASLAVTFVNRVIPLFQFGIFYNGDLELNSTSPMQINGWVHSNANIYVQPAGVTGNEANSITTFLANVSAAGSIYNRVDAWTPGVGRTGITRVLLTGNACAATAATPANCQDFPAYDAAVTDPLTTTQISAFPNKKVQDGASGISILKTPQPSFTRKRNYYTNKIGEYYAKADMRLEMVPDRDVTDKTPPVWTRDRAIIPFNFTAITTGGTGTCTTTTPTTGSDPDDKYVDLTREKLSTLHCNKFNKGQLQSLRQPVMVLTNINQTAALQTPETNTFNNLGKPATLPTPPTLSVNAATKQKIVRALQLALVSTPKPLPFEKLATKFDDPTYDAPANALYPDLNPFKQGFSDLLINKIGVLPVGSPGNGTQLTTNDRDNLLKAKPNEIAALVSAWFLPAPIQRVERPTADTTTTALADPTNNPRSSGFFDRREQRWITMLQTNIASLSVWNRDGVYVDASNETMTAAYAPDTAKRGTAFDAVNTFDVTNATPGLVVFNGANSTNGLAFDRATADATKPVGSLQYLGLGSKDTTEGGLVFHATVRDDLNGDGSLQNANDVTIDTTNEKIFQKKPDNTDFTDAGGNKVIIDYYRRYAGQSASKQSLFGFAFNGGDYLPNALLLSSDQAIYVQGNFNNNGFAQSLTAANTPSPNRLPAAIIADTITVLSNECVSLTTVGVTNQLGVYLGQLKCGIPQQINGANVTFDLVQNPMAINAAFLSNTQVSNGNMNRDNGTGAVYSGGVNNYIRLLENWNNGGTPYALNYTGSLISLGSPLEYNGAYQPGGINPALGVADTSYYDIPFRNVNYDLFFSNVEKLPPLTPKVSYIQQKNFGRAY
jgi:Tfp pilus assembly protein PilX